MTDGYGLILKVFFKKAVLWKHLLSSLSTSADDSFWTGVQMEEQDGKTSAPAVSIQIEETLILIDFMNQSSPLSCSSVKYHKLLPILLSLLLPLCDSIAEYLPKSKWSARPMGNWMVYVSLKVAYYTMFPHLSSCPVAISVLHRSSNICLLCHPVECSTTLHKASCQRLCWKK